MARHFAAKGTATTLVSLPREGYLVAEIKKLKADIFALRSASSQCLTLEDISRIVEALKWSIHRTENGTHPGGKERALPFRETLDKLREIRAGIKAKA